MAEGRSSELARPTLDRALRMKNCLQCQVVIGNDEAFCPSCDPSRRKPAGWGKRILGGCAVFVAAFIGLGAFMSWMTWRSPHALQSGEGQIRANLFVIRAAVSIYHQDNGGKYPETLEELAKGGKYLAQIPRLWSVYSSDYPVRGPDHHPATSDAVNVQTFKAGDSGKWGYVNNPQDPNYGTVFIDCEHTDSKGSAWTAY